MINQDELKSLITYEPSTGIFTWKVSKGAAKSGRVAGSSDGLGYSIICINGRKIRAHRLAFLYMTGSIPETIDHINGNPSDNSWENIREASISQNRMNSKSRSNNRSGVKGVHWCKTHQKWVAQVTINRKTKTIGYFHDLIGAELAVRKARIELHGDFANHG